nr:hypothetical protein GCM10020241_55000 [Streptoalloteichus tenebrarius]
MAGTGTWPQTTGPEGGGGVVGRAVFVMVGGASVSPGRDEVVAEGGTDADDVADDAADDAVVALAPLAAAWGEPPAVSWHAVSRGLIVIAMRAVAMTAGARPRRRTGVSSPGGVAAVVVLRCGDTARWSTDVFRGASARVDRH